MDQQKYDVWKTGVGEGVKGERKGEGVYRGREEEGLWIGLRKRGKGRRR